MKRSNVLKEVVDEVDRQEKLWGNKSHHPSVWLTILTEEVGETAKEICNAGFDSNFLEENYKTELIQVAATAISAIIDYEKER